MPLSGHGEISTEMGTGYVRVKCATLLRTCVFIYHDCPHALSDVKIKCDLSILFFFLLPFRQPTWSPKIESYPLINHVPLHPSSFPVFLQER